MRAALLGFVLALAAATPLLAQGDTRDFYRKGPAAEREMYYARVRQETYNLLVRWGDEWGRDDAARLASLYAEEGSYYPPAVAPVQTRAAIRDYYARILPGAGNVSIQMLDFGTSGDMAYIAARVAYAVALPAGQLRQVLTTDIIIFRRHQKYGWQIEMHVARAEEPDHKPQP